MLFLLVFRAEALRPPLLRRDDDFRRDDFRAPALRALLALFRVRFFAPPLLRPEDPDRDLFLPLFDLLDFLAAAMEGLRVGGFVATDSKIRAQQCGTHRTTLHRTECRHPRHHRSTRVSPCCMIQRSLPSRPDACHSSRIRLGGSSIGSSVSLNVPQWAAATISGFPCCAVFS